MTLITSGVVNAICTATNPSLSVSESMLKYFIGQGPYDFQVSASVDEPAGSTGCDYQLDVVFASGPSAGLTPGWLSVSGSPPLYSLVALSVDPADLSYESLTFRFTITNASGGPLSASKTIQTAISTDPCIHTQFVKQDLSPDPLTYQIAYGAVPVVLLFGWWTD